MPLLQTTTEVLQNSNRIIVVVGPRATGKTTFSVSASQFAGRHMDGDEGPDGKRQRTRHCNDVLVIQGDKEGVFGAMDAGLHPAFVVDMTSCENWGQYLRRAKEALLEAKPLIEERRIKVIVVDLNFPAKLIERYVEELFQRDPQKGLQMKDWRMVASQGLHLQSLFSQLSGVTVVANAQIKAANAFVEGGHGEAAQARAMAARDAATAKSIGGIQSRFSIDLPKGISTPWLDNASFMFARDLIFKKERDADGERLREYRITMQSSSVYEAKSRAQNRLPRHPLGVKTLRLILEEAYGKAL